LAEVREFLEAHKANKKPAVVDNMIVEQVRPILASASMDYNNRVTDLSMDHMKELASERVAAEARKSIVHIEQHMSRSGKKKLS
jgi:uncharacterized protein YeeX (DUF496 family)